MNDAVHGSEWTEYLDKLYEWVNSRLTAYQNGEITKEQYYKDYDYYKLEIKRVYAIIEGQKRNKKNHEPIQSQVIKPDLIFKYFYENEPVPEDVEEITHETQEPNLHDSFEITQGNPIPQDMEVSQTQIDPPQVTPNVFKALEKLPTKANVTKTKEPIPLQIVLLGESGVGRSSLRRAFLGKHFIPEHLSTVGAAMDDKIITVDDQPYKVTLVDLGGQDFYAPIRANFYRKAKGALLVFDLTRKETFVKLDAWLREFFRHTKRGLPFVIVGNKADLKRMVPYEEGRLLAENLSKQTSHVGFEVKYFETSAKDNYNVELVFEDLIRQIAGFEEISVSKLQN